MQRPSARTSLFDLRVPAAAMLAACLSGPALAAGGDSGPFRWTTTTTDEAGPGGVAIGSDGTTFAAISRVSGDRDITVEAVAPDGSLLWTAVWPEPGDNVATSVTLAGDDLLVGGWSRFGDQTDAVMLTYSLDGVLLRENRVSVGGMFAFPDVHVAVAGNGRRALATLSQDAPTSVQLRSWDANGTLEFAREWAFTGFGQIGDLFVAGDDSDDLLLSTSGRVGQNAAYFVRRIDPAGTDVYETVLDGATNFLASDLHLAPHADGTVTAAGTPELAGGILAIRVTRLAADGQILWDVLRPANSGSFTIAADLVTATAPGEEGAAWLGFSGDEQRIERIDPDGSVSQSTTISLPQFLLRLEQLDTDDAGRVVAVVSQRVGPLTTPADIRTLRLAADGQIGWESLYVGPAGEVDFFNDLATGPGETIAVSLSTRANDGVNTFGVVQYFDLAACIGDVDGDGTTGFGDLVTLLGAWDTLGGAPQDLDGSGVVDLADLVAVLSAWGPCGG